jgi:hypothetical protein
MEYLKTLVRVDASIGLSSIFKGTEVPSGFFFDDWNIGRTDVITTLACLDVSKLSRGERRFTFRNTTSDPADVTKCYESRRRRNMSMIIQQSLSEQNKLDRRATFTSNVSTAI